MISKLKLDLFTLSSTAFSNLELAVKIKKTEKNLKYNTL